MKRFMKPGSFGLNLRAYVLFSFLVLLAVACRKNDHVKQQLKDFTQVNLVDNNGNYGAAHKDTGQKNAWGLAWSPTGVAWVNSQAGHVSALYDKEGVTKRKSVNIPSPADTIGGNPTGIVFNGTTDFVISNGAPALFIFVGVDGVLSGWNGPAGNNAKLIKNNAATAAYTGLAIGASGGANYIYAADFRGGKIQVWDKSFSPVDMLFQDPWLPAGYSPFNIQAVGNWLYVTYAKVGADGRDAKGAGNGLVSIFSMDGSFVTRFATRGQLNSPWGVAQAPAGFFDDADNGGMDDNGIGKYDHHYRDSITILIGNFGDGKINAYSPHGDYLGQLKSHGHTISIDGLWAIGFAPATPATTPATIETDRLYFTAGPDHEQDGLFGYLIKN